MSATPPQSFSLALRSYSGQIELHEHDFHQIVLPQSGSMEIEVDGWGGKVAAWGEYIDDEVVYQYVGWKTLPGQDGFPVNIRVVKVVK